MKRTNSDLLAFAAVLLPAVLFCAAGWMALPDPDRSAGSGLLAALILVVNSLLLFFIDDRVLSDTSLIAPVTYIVLAAANPAALSLTTLHAASLLMAVSLLACLYYCAIRPALDILSIACATLGGAALFFPPLAWLLPVYAVITVTRAEDKGKYIVAILFATILPAAVWIGIQYLRGAALPGGILRDLWTGMSGLHGPALHFSAAAICRIGLIVITATLAAIHVLKRLSRYRTSQFIAYVRLLVLTLALVLLNLLFLTDSSRPLGLLTLLPVALLINEYFRDQNEEKGSWILALILLLVLVVERISLFV